MTQTPSPRGLPAQSGAASAPPALSLLLVLCGALISTACASDDGPTPPAEDASPTDGDAADPGADGGPTDPGPAPPWGGRDILELVDPMITTGGLGFNVGNGFPGPSHPFGLIQPSPDTDGGPYGGIAGMHCGGYHHTDTRILGFSHTHLHAVGIPEYGNFLLMPDVGAFGAEATARWEYHSPFDHADEAASPGYYSVRLAGPDIRAELTASLRAGVHRYRFPSGSGVGGDGSRLVVVDFAHTVPDGEILDADLHIGADGREVSGRVFNRNAFSERYGGLDIYFAARFGRAPSSWGTWSGGPSEREFAEGETARSGTDIGALFSFDDGDDELLVEVGLSFTSEANAWLNLEAEVAGRGFDAVRDEAEAAWRQELAPIRAWGGSDERQRVLATALYHALMMPNVFEDVNGEYIGFDGLVHDVADLDAAHYYTNFSLWDTYRTQHPLLMLSWTERHRELTESLLTMTEQGGFLPKWPQGIGYTDVMLGAPCDVVVAEAYLKGAGAGADDAALERAWDALMTTAYAAPPPGSPTGGRGGIEEYIQYGYVPEDLVGDSVAKTLEFAVGDHAIARLAELRGDAEAAAEFFERARSYQALWEPDSQFMVGLTSTGERVMPETFDLWDPLFVEGNAWQYMWLVPHDAHGLRDLFGSNEGFISKLETLFESSVPEQEAFRLANDEGSIDALAPAKWYWHGNEPDIHAPFLFNAGGRADLTQQWSTWVADTLYHLGPDGIPGNDDCGTLSAWYVFAAAGFYPVNGDDLYFVSTPLFDRMELDVPGGTLAVLAERESAGSLYVEGLTLNGEAIDVPWLRHADLAGGGELVFTLVDEATDWGSAGADRLR